MSKLREAVQLGLDALSKSVPDARDGDDDYRRTGWKEHADAVVALSSALAEPDPERKDQLNAALGVVFDWDKHEPTGERAERKRVGDSKFESWYSELPQAGKGSKQIAREAYEAGMNADMLGDDSDEYVPLTQDAYDANIAHIIKALVLKSSEKSFETGEL